MMQLCKALGFAVFVTLAGTAVAQAPADDKSADKPPADKPSAVTSDTGAPNPTSVPDAAADDGSSPSTTTAQTQAAPAPEPASKTQTSEPQSTAGSGETVGGATYAVRLRDLEQRIDELKEQIRRSHTRLSLLSDTILSGGVGGARAEIVLQNDLSDAFRVTGVMFVLDGAVQYNKEDDTGTLASQKDIPIFSGSIPPGDHTIQVKLKARGHGYGVFSYLRGYKFSWAGGHSFTITEGKTINLTSVVYEKGDVTTPLEQRPAIRFHEKVSSGSAPAEGAQPVLSGQAPSSPSGGVKAGASGSVNLGPGGK